jgi:hypothetical protein
MQEELLKEITELRAMDVEKEEIISKIVIMFRK